MVRKTLIFLVTADPRGHGSAVATACHYAQVAAGAGLPAELRLAGDAVLVADPAHVASVGDPVPLRDRLAAAVAGGVAVSACPRSAEARGVSGDQLAAVGARPRGLDDVLTEVAGGRAVLIPVGNGA